jgi:hypothetical protein
MSTIPERDATRDTVRQRYADIARVTMAVTASATSCCAPSCCGAMARMQHPFYETIAAHLPEGTPPADYITSLDISAQKPSWNPS